MLVTGRRWDELPNLLRDGTVPLGRTGQGDDDAKAVSYTVAVRSQVSSRSLVAGVVGVVEVMAGSS